MNHAARVLLSLLAISAASATSEHPNLGAPNETDDQPISSVGATSQFSPHQGDGRPTVTVRDASLDQAEMLRWGVDRFTEAGLDLPALDVTFHRDVSACDGFNGVYRTQGGAAVIDICHTRRHIILHELAHAWDAQEVTDQTRERFMAYRGLMTWADPDVAWGERGIEQAAETITLVLNWRSYSGPIDQPEIVHELCGYEVLTGRPLPDSLAVNCGLHHSPTLHPAGPEGACTHDTTPTQRLRMAAYLASRPSVRAAAT